MVDENVRTALRERYQRSATLDIEGQTRECVEYIEHPDILVAEFADSYLTASEYDRSSEEFWTPPDDLPRRRISDDVTDQLMRASQVRLLEKPERAFRYVAREIFPLRAELGGHTEGDRRSAGLDYVGLQSEDCAVPILGVIEVPEDRPPFLCLMRLLTCLAEVSTEAQLKRANRFLFKGALGDAPSFDLHVIAADQGEPEEYLRVAQLTHDLSEVFHARLREEWQFPNLLRHIYYLDFDSKAFDGSLGVLWRV